MVSKRRDVEYQHDSEAWSSAASPGAAGEATTPLTSPRARRRANSLGIEAVPRCPLPAAHRKAASVAILLAATACLAAGCFLVPNTLPIAGVDADRTEGVAPLAVHFDGTDSFDPDGSIRRYRWDFGDGDTITGIEVDHTYTHAGTFEATLTVADQRGGTGSASIEIHVRASNALPVASFSAAPSPAYPRQIVRFSAAASYDPDGEIESYAWAFGDGTTATGVTTSHQYAAQGTYNVVLAVRDNDGGERTTATSLHVTSEIDTSGTVPRHYEWNYNETAQSCDLEISRDLYIYYKIQPRSPFSQRDYDEYVLDPLDDEDLETITDKIVGTAAGDRYAAFEDALFFVQHCIEYVNDPLWFEYPRYPIEVLVDEIGDCEDTAILYTSLIRTLGYGALMVAVDTSGDGVADHMIAWVPVEQSFATAHPDLSFWQYEGKTYAFAETAVEGGYLALGVDPWGLTTDDIDTVYDVSSVDREPRAVHLEASPSL